MYSRLFILAAAVLWSTAGAAIKLAPLDGWQISTGRSLVAGLVLMAAIPDARRRLDLRVFGTALAYAGTVLFFVLANKVTTAANAIFLQSAAPLYVMLLSPWLLRERPSRATLASVPLFVAGLVLLFVDQLQPGRLAGNLMAAASGVTFAFTILGMRGLGDRSIAACAWGNLLAAVIGLPFALSGPIPTVPGVAIVVYLGVFQLGLAYVCFTRGLRQTPALEASLLVLLEPVLNPIWALLLVGEAPGLWALAGGALLLAGTLWQTVQPWLAALMARRGLSPGCSGE